MNGSMKKFDLNTALSRSVSPFKILWKNYVVVYEDCLGTGASFSKANMKMEGGNLILMNTRCEEEEIGLRVASCFIRRCRGCLNYIEMKNIRSNLIKLFNHYWEKTGSISQILENGLNKMKKIVMNRKMKFLEYLIVLYSKFAQEPGEEMAESHIRILKLIRSFYTRILESASVNEIKEIADSNNFLQNLEYLAFKEDFVRIVEFDSAGCNLLPDKWEKAIDDLKCWEIAELSYEMRYTNQAYDLGLFWRFGFDSIQYIFNVIIKRILLNSFPSHRNLQVQKGNRKIKETQNAAHFSKDVGTHRFTLGNQTINMIDNATGFIVNSMELMAENYRHSSIRFSLIDYKMYVVTLSCNYLGEMTVKVLDISKAVVQKAYRMKELICLKMYRENIVMERTSKGVFFVSWTGKNGIDSFNYSILDNISKYDSFHFEKSKNSFLDIWPKLSSIENPKSKHPAERPVILQSSKDLILVILYFYVPNTTISQVNQYHIKDTWGLDSYLGLFRLQKNSSLSLVGSTNSFIDTNREGGRVNAQKSSLECMASLIHSNSYPYILQQTGFPLPLSIFTIKKNQMVCVYKLTDKMITRMVNCHMEIDGVKSLNTWSDDKLFKIMCFNTDQHNRYDLDDDHNRYSSCVLHLQVV